MLMLNTTILLQVFIDNKGFAVGEMLATNKMDGIKSNDELIEKFEKLLRIEKLLKGLKLSKSRN